MSDKKFQYTVHILGEGPDEYLAWDEAVDTLKALEQDQWPEWQRVEEIEENAGKDKDVPAEATDVQGLVDGYDDIATEFEGRMCPDEEEVAKILHDKHDWTDNGAKVVVDLAMKYGAFVLRNALALAIVLDVEDGSEGL
jgi:hypothetical protein